MVFISDDEVSYASLSVYLTDPASWDPDDIAFALTASPSAQVCTGSITIFLREVFVPIRLFVNYEPERQNVEGALAERVTFASGELWIVEVGDGSKRSGATVQPGTYAVQLSYPPEGDDPQVYAVTLFDRQDIEAHRTS